MSAVITDSRTAILTDIYEGQAALVAQALGRAGRADRLEVFAVKLQNRLTNLNNTPNPLELMVGTYGNTDWNMLPGQESPWIYTRNLNDIFVRVRVAVVVSEVLGAVTAITIAAGGAGYVVGDVLTIAGGGGGATFRVTTVLAGAVTGTQLISGGVGYAIAAGVATSGSAGVGATVNITAVLDELNTVRFPFMCRRFDDKARVR